MKHKKTLLAIILCIVLIVSAFALVACDDNDGDNNKNHDEAISNISEFVGHAISFGRSFNYLISGIYSNDLETFYSRPDTTATFSKYANEGALGSIACQFADFSNSDFSIDNVKLCAVLFYKSDAEATKALEIETDDETDGGTIYDFFQNAHIRQNGSILILETQEGLYEEIMSSQLANDIPINACTQFINDSTATILSNYDTFIFTCYGMSREDSDSVNIALSIFPDGVMGHNPAGRYICEFADKETLDEYAEDINSKIGTEYTADSYARVENGVLYAYYKEISNS